jgi:outer membrane protein TolC
MPNASLTQQSEEQMRERAYEIYLARGGQGGDEVSDWLAAEREGKKARAARFALNLGLVM